MSEAIISKPIQIVSLDNRVLNIFVDEIVSPNSVKKVSDEGMPIINNIITNEVLKGILFVNFNIIFPKYISPDKKEQITNILDEQQAIF